MLETRRGGSTDFIPELLQQTPFLYDHLFWTKWQHQQFEDMRILCPVPSSLLMMVLDFAENFACLHQNEVQAAHWHHDQLTIHPVCTYYKCSNCSQMVTESVVCISDDLKHDHHAVQVFTSVELLHLKKKKPHKNKTNKEKKQKNKTEASLHHR